MPNDTRDARAESALALRSWGMPLPEAFDDLSGDAAWWLGGGALLLAWTALALLLTSA